MINQTRSAKELEPSASDAGFTNDDLDHIVLSVTQTGPSFDAMVNDIINDFLSDHADPPELQTSTQVQEALLMPVAESDAASIKQRLRRRPAKNARAKKTPKRVKKINIISNEPYTGIIPAVANLPPITSIVNAQPEITQFGDQAQVLVNVPMFVQNGDGEIIPVIQATQSLPGLMKSSTIVYQTEFPGSAEKPNVIEKKEVTPKLTMFPNYLEARSRSTPRHVRTLNFNQTPSQRMLTTLKEFSTPLSRVLSLKTPGSAPASIGSCEPAKKLEEPIQDVIDDNSNSNSISNTPKVAKGKRRRKIADSKSVVTKSAEKREEQEENVIDDWYTQRNMASLPVDAQARLIYEKSAKNSLPLKRKPSKKKNALASKNKSSSTSPEEPSQETSPENGKDDNSTSTEYDENKPLSKMMKFKIASPRKKAALKNTPKKKRKTPIKRGKKTPLKKKPEKSVKKNSKTAEKIAETELIEEVAAVENQVVQHENKEVDELNRSDTVQEVASLMINLPEIIQSVEESEADVDKAQVDSGIEQNQLLETPFKDFLETPLKTDSMTPLPNTPRFAIPLTSSVHETPMPKIFASSGTITSIIKNCDILTPNFPITPGFKETPPKDALEGSPAAGSGYSSRRTDYSSCSSYYKPDESEDVNQNLNSYINQRHSQRNNSQSESDGGNVNVVKQIKNLLGSVKKVDCPGAIERIKSFNEEVNDLPMPQYEMMEEGLLSESYVTEATECSSSSNTSSCTTCSTCSSTTDNESTVDQLDKDTKTDDSEWDCNDQEIKTAEIVTPTEFYKREGGVRYPLRNHITPRKIDDLQMQIEQTNEIKSHLSKNNPQSGLSLEEEQKRLRQELEAKKQRVLKKMKEESSASHSKCQPKFTKLNVKSFKVPTEEAHKPAYVSRKDQILSQNLTQRPRPTELKLNSTYSSSSRRKNATPRKTIVINELPRQSSPLKKRRGSKIEGFVKSPLKIELQPKSQSKVEAKGKSQENVETSPTKSERLSLESVNDNAVMPEDSTSLEMSSSFDTSNVDEETGCTVVIATTAVFDEGSNTFQKSLIAQGFDKDEAKNLQTELVDKLEEVPTNVEEIVEVQETDEVMTASEEVTAVDQEESSSKPEKLIDSSEDSSSSDDDGEEFEECLADVNEKNVFEFKEPSNFKTSIAATSKPEVSKMILRFDDLVVSLCSSETFDLFTVNPKPGIKSTSRSKKTSPKKNGKDSPNKNGKSKSSKKSDVRWDQSKTGHVSKS